MRLRRVVAIVARHRGWFAAGVGLGVLAIVANVSLMATSAYLISRSAVIQNVADVALVVTAVRVLAIARAALRYLERLATHRATFRALTDIRVWAYRSIEPLAPARLDPFRSGDLLSRVVADVDTLQDVQSRVLSPPIVAVGVGVFSIGLLGAFDTRSALALALFLVLAGLLVPLAIRRFTRGPAAAVVRGRAELHATLVDAIEGLPDLVAFDRARRHETQVLERGDDLDRDRLRLARVRGAGGALVALCASLAGIAALAVAIPEVSSGRLDGAYLGLLALAAIASFEAIQPLPLAVELGDATMTAAERLFELTDTRPAVVDPEAPVPLASAKVPPPAAHAQASHVPAGRQEAPALQVRGLRFAYPGAAAPVFAGLDLAVAPGGSLALVGPSGAGKSTLVSLLLRFWEYADGEILLGGRELRSCAADDVRRAIAVVPQRVDLFNGTIRDNLAVADADVTDERMEEACRLALLDDVIRSLPDGYDTVIGEDGLRLSGGERQRLAIARMVVKDAPLVVFDEGTSDLDPATEARLMDSLTPFLAGRTTLLITHRASLAARADTTLVLADGRARRPRRG